MRPWRRSASAICTSSLIAPRQTASMAIASRVFCFIATLPPQTIVIGRTPRGSAAIDAFAAARQHELQRSSAGVIQRYPVATGRPALTMTATSRGSQSGVGSVSASMKATMSSSGRKRSSAASWFQTFWPAFAASPATVVSSGAPGSASAARSSANAKSSVLSTLAMMR